LYKLQVCYIKKVLNQGEGDEVGILKRSFRGIVLCAFALALVVTPLLSIIKVSAIEPSYWMGNGTPTITIDENPVLPRGYVWGSVPCTQTEFPVKSNSGNYGGNYTDQKTYECASETPYGTLSNSYLQLPNTKYAGRLDIWNSTTAMPIANSNNLIGLGWGTSWGASVRGWNNANKGLFVKGPAWGGVEWSYGVNRAPDHILQNSNGEWLGVGSFAFSSNGEWMVAQLQTGSYARINLSTFEILPFAPTHSSSQSQSLQLAISDDGRYAAAAGNDYAYRFQIFDLSTCSQPATPNDTTIVSGCGVRYMQPFLTSQNLTGMAPSKLLFSTDNTQLSATIYDDVNDVSKRITITAPGKQADQLDYLALGDSFSSGEGDTNRDAYIPQTNHGPTQAYPFEERCHVSNRSYPFLLAQKMGLSGNKVKNVACAGAKITDVVAANSNYLGQGELLGKVNESSRVIYQDEANNFFIPGRVAQIDFVKKYKPKAITISIGGNDVNFGDKVAECAPLSVFSCSHASDPGQKKIDGLEIQQLYNNLSRLYSQIHAASPASKIYAIGYPKFVKESTACAANVGFDDNERQYVNAGTEYINTVIESAAKKAGVAYVDIQSALSGYELCAGGVSQVAVNGVREGRDFLEVGGQKWIGKESYHPTQLGHRLMANRILSQVQGNLLSYDNCPNTLETTCADNATTVPLLSAYFNTSVAAPSFAQYSASILEGRYDVVEKYNAAAVNILGSMLAPGSSVHVEIHSTPTALGDYTVNSYGEFNAAVSIPSSLPAGVHTLHIYGTSIAEQPIDLYQPIVVLGNSSDDIDEDGVPNSIDPCTFTTPSETDIDQDGIDDACDGTIDTATSSGVLYRGRAAEDGSVYIERSVAAAASQLGFIDDDFDSDGWSVVGHTNDAAINGRFAKLIMYEGMPFAMINHPTSGCISAKPASLDQVEPNTNRELVLTSPPSGATCQE
jgi:lysophospholipase L1-like esterase